MAVALGPRARAKFIDSDGVERWGDVLSAQVESSENRWYVRPSPDAVTVRVEWFSDPVCTVDALGAFWSRVRYVARISLTNILEWHEI